MRNENVSPKVVDYFSADDRAEYDQILRLLLRKYAPAHIIETHIVESLACDVWTSRRMVRIRSLSPCNPQETGRCVRDLATQRLALAAQSYSRNLRMLNKMRKTRAAAEPAHPAQSAPRRRPAPPRTVTGEWIN